MRSILALLSCISLAAGAEKRALEFRDIIEINEPSQARISPDGMRVAFLLSKASMATNSTARSLWVVSPGSAPKRLLDEAPAGPVVWGADSASLLLQLARPGNVAYWRLALDGSAPTPVFEHPNPVFSAWWSPDRSEVLFTSTEPESKEEQQRPEREGLLYDESVNGIRNFTRGTWAQSPKPTLWRWAVGMKSAERVSADFSAVGSVGSVAWSPDGERAALEYSPADRSAASSSNIGILYLRGASASPQFHPLVSSAAEILGVQWAPDSRSVVFTETGDPNRYYVPAGKIRTVDLESKRAADVPGTGLWYYGNFLTVDADGNLIIEYEDWSRSTLYRVLRQGGSATPIYKGEKHLSGCSYATDKRFAACLLQSFTEAPEVAKVNVHSGAVEVLTKLNPQFDEIALHPATERRFRNRYGYETNGFLVLPSGFRKGTPVPLVLIQYAFSNKFTTQAQWITSYPVQHLANAGIAVLLLNHPHELGWKAGDFKGAAMSQAYNPLASMEAAIDTLAFEGIVDRKRVGIAGWSFGAYLAELAITQTDLFRVASAGEGGLNNAGQYWVTGSAAMQAYLDAFFGGPPFGEAYANYKSLSPGLNADRVDAPLLREYGTDVGVQSLEFYMALKRLGKPVEQYIYLGAPHVLDKPSQRIASMQRNLDWFRFWLLGYEDPAGSKKEQYLRWRAFRGSGR